MDHGKWEPPSQQRNERIFEMRSKGASLRAIGAEFGLCAESIRAVCAKIERQRAWRRRKYEREAARGRNRPLDMGGRRDEWIEWTPQMQAAEFASAIGEAKAAGVVT